MMEDDRKPIIDDEALKNPTPANDMPADEDYLGDGILQVLDKYTCVRQLMEFLELPVEYAAFREDLISTNALYDLIMDEDRCQKLITKLKNKAFW
jgi:hypothetical protein